ncbi:MAG: hypothetical protein KKB79_02640, partial [Nanoarchaeota archaeon]|nr:hypothetical protein [Nanoarchaeota archaeon]
MRMNKMRAAFVLSVLLVGLFALSFISAQFSSSFVAKTPTSQFSDYGGSAFDSSMCREGQDFVLQISPKGCTPSVVRSDLLEKQNVPVFCPISAVQLNPLIDVEAIDGMTINGEVSGGSVGGFHPARAALGRGDLKVNSPVLGNIGYAVIVLRQNRNESSMPDFVEGNLTARISYDIKEHFGVGQATLYLPVMDDAEWNAGFNHYGFWEGLGYLRAESVGDERATISIYAGKADSSKIHGGKITSRTISVGQTSSDISLSGAAYCLAGLNIRLDGLEAADKTVRLNINGEFTEVKEGEKFLDNRCRIRKINSYGVIDEAVVSCDEDSKQSTFTLTFSPKV